MNPPFGRRPHRGGFARMNTLESPELPKETCPGTRHHPIGVPRLSGSRRLEVENAAVTGRNCPAGAFSSFTGLPPAGSLAACRYSVLCCATGFHSWSGSSSVPRRLHTKQGGSNEVTTGTGVWYAMAWRCRPASETGRCLSSRIPPRAKHRQPGHSSFRSLPEPPGPCLFATNEGESCWASPAAEPRKNGSSSTMTGALRWAGNVRAPGRQELSRGRPASREAKGAGWIFVLP